VTEPPVSADALFGGGLKLFQPAAGFGYRANVDAILLAAFAGRGRAWRDWPSTWAQEQAP